MCPSDVRAARQLQHLFTRQICFPSCGKIKTTPVARCGFANWLSAPRELGTYATVGTIGATDEGEFREIANFQELRRRIPLLRRLPRLVVVLIVHKTEPFLG